MAASSSIEKRGTEKQLRAERWIGEVGIGVSQSFFKKWIAAVGMKPRLPQLLDVPHCIDGSGARLAREPHLPHT
jgi:hypothetical protein